MELHNRIQKLTEGWGIDFFGVADLSLAHEAIADQDGPVIAEFPQAGPRVRWATVLTDTPLPITGEPMEERYGSCRQCVDICPQQAFTGEPFREHEPREVCYDARKL